MNLEDAYEGILRDPSFCFIYWSGTVTKLTKLHFGWKQIDIIPGSFNPLHAAHKALKPNYNGFYMPQWFEMSIERMGKEPLTLGELEKRLHQFDGYERVLVEYPARMVDKIANIKRIVDDSHLNFHIGMDTFNRMLDDYGLSGIEKLDANFYCHDRIIVGDLISSLSHFGKNNPSNCFQEPPHSEELMRISSTQIREQQGK